MSENWQNCRRSVGLLIHFYIKSQNFVRHFSICHMSDTFHDHWIQSLLAHVMAWALFGVKSLPNQTMKLFCINHKDNKMWKLSFICKIFRCNTTTTSKCIIFWHTLHANHASNQKTSYTLIWKSFFLSGKSPSISIIPIFASHIIFYANSWTYASGSDASGCHS